MTQIAVLVILLPGVGAACDVCKLALSWCSYFQVWGLCVNVCSPFTLLVLSLSGGSHDWRHRRRRR